MSAAHNALFGPQDDEVPDTTPAVNTALASLVEAAIRLSDARKSAEATAADIKAQSIAASDAALTALMQSGMHAVSVDIDGRQRRFSASSEMYASIHVESPDDICVVVAAFAALGAEDMVKQSPVNAQSLGAWLRERASDPDVGVVYDGFHFNADDFLADPAALVAYIGQYEACPPLELLRADRALLGATIDRARSYAIARQFNVPLDLASKIRIVEKVKASIRRA